jgi:hypothetical protein
MPIGTTKIPWPGSVPQTLAVHANTSNSKHRVKGMDARGGEETKQRSRCQNGSGNCCEERKAISKFQSGRQSKSLEGKKAVGDKEWMSNFGRGTYGCKCD